MDPRVAIVVPSWNGRRAVGDAALDACLTAALGQDGVRAVVILVDNGSDDGTVAWVRERHPAVVVVALDENRGFAGGVNAGIRRALEDDVDAVALLNNDAVPDPTWLQTLVAVLDDPGVGIATCKLVREDGRIDSTGDQLTTWGLPLPRGRDEEDHGQHDGQDVREVFSASGGATVYRCALLEDVGLFDERFFAYYEDVDLAFRARLRGWSVRYEPAARAVHGLNRTSVRVPGLVERHSLKNMLLLWCKDMPGALLLRHAPKLLVMLVFRITLTVRTVGARVALGALVETARYLPAALRDRRRIQSTRTMGPRQIEALLDHDWRPRAFGGPRRARGRHQPC